MLAQSTPNPAARQFWPSGGQVVLDSPGPALEYRSRTVAAAESQLASGLLSVSTAVTAVTLAENFVTVRIDLGCTDWESELPMGRQGGRHSHSSLSDCVEAVIEKCMASDAPIVSAGVTARRLAAVDESICEDPKGGLDDWAAIASLFLFLA